MRKTRDEVCPSNDCKSRAVISPIQLHQFDYGTQTILNENPREISEQELWEYHRELDLVEKHVPDTQEQIELVEGKRETERLNLIYQYQRYVISDLKMIDIL